MRLLSAIEILIATGALVVIVMFIAIFSRRNVGVWLPAYFKRDWQAKPVAPGVTRHLMFCFVDHYEPRWGAASYEVECQRVARWSQEYPQLCAGHRDADGRAPVHSFFYPEEEYRPEHLDAVVDLCRQGLGEIDIHLHHHDDTAEGLREKLRRFTRTLIDRHDALPIDPVTGQARWGFIHGNWALDNSDPHGHNCGINNELIVLREEGCYADFTFPAAPHPAQTSTINQIYYAKDDPHQPKSHDRGQRVRVGGKPWGDLMLIQGPLGISWHNRKFGLFPRIENADIRTSNPPTPKRVDAWVKTGVHVEGRPEWIFVKIHTHGTQERDMGALLGEPMRQTFEHLESRYNDGQHWQLHYVSAREMYNITKAAEAGLSGNPNAYRDHLIPRPQYRTPAEMGAARDA